MTSYLVRGHRWLRSTESLTPKLDGLRLGSAGILQAILWCQVLQRTFGNRKQIFPRFHWFHCVFFLIWNYSGHAAWNWISTRSWGHPIGDALFAQWLGRKTVQSQLVRTRIGGTCSDERPAVETEWCCETAGVWITVVWCEFQTTFNLWRAGISGFVELIAVVAQSEATASPLSSIHKIIKNYVFGHLEVHSAREDQNTSSLMNLNLPPCHSKVISAEFEFDQWESKKILSKCGRTKRSIHCFWQNLSCDGMHAICSHGESSRFASQERYPPYRYRFQCSCVKTYYG